MEAQKLLHTQRLEEINVQADISESQALYQHSEVKYTGVKWADALLALHQGFVRPNLTYLFTAFYALAKYAQFLGLQRAGWNNVDAITRIYAGEDLAILASIIGFWFGGRMMKWSIERWSKK
jgi:hypothetical protein